MSILPLHGFLSIITGYTPLEAALVALDILIVAVFLYVAFTFIKGTRALRIVLGLAVLAGIGLLARVLQLDTLNWLLSHLTTLIIVAIPVVFQPELRRGLERLGRSGLGIGGIRLARRDRARVIREIVQAMRGLTETHTGGLIVVLRQTGISELLDSGTKLNAEVSAELLLNLFTPKAPLHDGAVVIQGDKILAAGVLLPLSDESFSYEHGTRHRAALGISEATDAIALVASEERGTVSIAIGGKLRPCPSLEKLDEELRALLVKERRS